MNNIYNYVSFDTALEILRSNIYDNKCSYMGAVLFVSRAFGISTDRLLKGLKEEQKKEEQNKGNSYL